MQLQQILGTDKRNPSFTIARDGSVGCLHVYYGGELFEKVPDCRNDPQYKLMVARLYNAGVNSVVLSNVFGVDQKTMRRWGDALKSGDAELLMRVLAGRQAHRKLTTEISAFVRTRFPSVHAQYPRSYSKQMRIEIAEIFDVHLSAETLRPSFGKLRGKTANPPKQAEQQRETPCDLCAEPEVVEPEPSAVSKPNTDETGAMHGKSNRKGSPICKEPDGGNVQFIHHLGVLLFSAVLHKVETQVADAGWILKQWLACMLLGAVNIEQSKLLDFDGLATMLGKTLRSRRPQRLLLSDLAQTDATTRRLLAINADEVDSVTCDDFYYDPHTKQYTGQLRILKGWCGSRHFADKALHMDFIHTASGHPIYVAYADNYEDLRERFDVTTIKFRSILPAGATRVLTFVLDRGIFGRDVFVRIAASERIHVVTWEKGYQQGLWDSDKVDGTFVMERARNRVADVRKYSFEYIDGDWSKDVKMRLIRVRATNPKKRTIELGILSDDRDRPAHELIYLMFNRWLQENDFKYLEKHFGINQITSYASISYEQLKDEVEDKQTKSGEYKALLKERQALRAKLKTKLFAEHQHPGRSDARGEAIRKLTKQDNELTEKFGDIDKEVSRLELLIEQKYRQLDTTQKSVMDALKLIARNSFYGMLQPFKVQYDNFRDDHAIFRNLTRAHGVLTDSVDVVLVQLFPTAHYPPALRNIVEDMLERLNADALPMPDSSGRHIIFSLGDKTGIELAS